MEIQKDIGEEVIRKFQDIILGLDRLKVELKNKDKKLAHEKIKSGQTQLAIGTHALIQNEVEFVNLGLAIIDEQHRFGVN